MAVLKIQQKQNNLPAQRSNPKNQHIKRIKPVARINPVKNVKMEAVRIIVNIVLAGAVLQQLL
ncbi:MULTISPECIES: hypothetical protein [Weeksellaceae]|jgi:hypothetical protein|uniref:hypothetical protein n=1 Tax=Weeksellaceae TaxID=2762318 RepID=UPI0004020B98|nr:MULTISPECIES: hypothetical protein [Weeksellaceae]KUG10625.1 hypothetical protein AMC91_16585 [Elizabethkingia miricola]